eukprot:gene32075-39619_t
MGGWQLIHIDDFVDNLLHEELVCDMALPHLLKRIKMEDLHNLPPRKSALDLDLLREDQEEGGSDEEVEEVKQTVIVAKKAHKAVAVEEDQEEGEEEEDEDRTASQTKRKNAAAMAALLNIDQNGIDFDADVDTEEVEGDVKWTPAVVAAPPKALPCEVESNNKQGGERGRDASRDDRDRRGGDNKKNDRSAHRDRSDDSHTVVEMTVEVEVAAEADLTVLLTETENNVTLTNILARRDEVKREEEEVTTEVENEVEIEIEKTVENEVVVMIVENTPHVIEVVLVLTHQITRNHTITNTETLKTEADAVHLAATPHEVTVVIEVITIDEVTEEEVENEEVLEVEKTVEKEVEMTAILVDRVETTGTMNVTHQELSRLFLGGRSASSYRLKMGSCESTAGPIILRAAAEGAG